MSPKEHLPVREVFLPHKRPAINRTKPQYIFVTKTEVVVNTKVVVKENEADKKKVKALSSSNALLNKQLLKTKKENEKLKKKLVKLEDNINNIIWERTRELEHKMYQALKDEDNKNRNIERLELTCKELAQENEELRAKLKLYKDELSTYNRTLPRSVSELERELRDKFPDKSDAEIEHLLSLSKRFHELELD